MFQGLSRNSEYKSESQKNFPVDTVGIREMLHLVGILALTHLFWGWSRKTSSSLHWLGASSIAQEWLKAGNISTSRGGPHALQ